MRNSAGAGDGFCMDRDESPLRMNFFGKKVPVPKPDRTADDAPPMLRALKEVWDINTEKKHERVDAPVSSDIYVARPRKNGIPPRHLGRRVEE